MNISLVIRTKNEEDGLLALLSCLQTQRFKFFEVLIVDSGSVDGTLSVAKEFNCKIIQISSDTFTFGHALNVGVSEASGDIVVSLSAHCLPVGEGWLTRLISPFKDHRVVGVYGAQIPFPDASVYERRGLLEAYPLDTHASVCVREMFSNAHSAFRKSAWNDISFSPQLSGSEDIDWALRQKQQGGKIVYQPCAVVLHSHHESLQQAYERAYRETRANLESPLIHFVPFGGFGAIARWVKAVVVDYVFLFRHFCSLWYTFTWLLFTPFYRAVIYYGQYKAIKHVTSR